MALSGRVIEEQKNYFLVHTTEGIIRSGIKGTLKKNRTRVCTGDLVMVEINNTDTLEGTIITIEKRSSFIHRPALANLTQIVFITTFKSPPLDLEALDRMLFSAEVYEIKPVIVFNKIDILSSEEHLQLKAMAEIYEKCGYQTLYTSASSGIGIDQLNALCANQISAFSGLSGVGKSSLLLRLFPGKDFRIGEVSGTQGRGTHTTTSIILIPHKDAGFIADTPGISFVDVPAVPEENVITCFPELANLIGQCRFNNCIHNDEPGCIVQEKAAQGEIAPFRVQHYLKLYSEMKSIRRQYRKS